MKIAIFGTSDKLEAFKKHSFRENIVADFFQQDIQADVNLSEYNVIFDLDADEQPENLSYYNNLSSLQWLILSSLKIQIEVLLFGSPEKINCKVAGINAVPFFLSNDLFEISFREDSDKLQLNQLFSELGLKLELVKDRVGMVRPRILYMIINEAYYTFQEGTAEKKDIDTAMKLGTSYPKGPFEFVQEIGIKEIYETLLAIQKDTQDDRYKIANLLKTEYFKSLNN